MSGHLHFLQLDRTIVSFPFIAHFTNTARQTGPWILAAGNRLLIVGNNLLLFKASADCGVACKCADEASAGLGISVWYLVFA